MIDFIRNLLSAYTPAEWLISITFGLLLGFFFLVPFVLRRPALSIWLLGIILGLGRLVVTYNHPDVGIYRSIDGLISWSIFIGCAYWGKRILEHAFGKETVQRQVRKEIERHE